MSKYKIEVTSYKGRNGSDWRIGLVAVLLACVLVFGALLGVVLSGAHDSVNGDPQVMVILGCQVKSWGPSELLQDRLDTALSYLETHPDMTIVVSGGQGADEPTSEAQAMYDYLTANGVDGEQILLEDTSRNTWQNLTYTLALLKEQDEGEKAGQVLVVSSGFHLSRVRMLFDRAWEGTYTLSTLAAPESHLPSRLAMYVREPLALVKSFLFDR
jgi:uncharacterized SAM-binding protein YcdF (DUF218 family)